MTMRLPLLSEESTALRLVGNHITEGKASLIRPDALALATERSIGIPITCSIARAAALHSIPRFSDRSSFANSRQALELDSLPLLAMCNDSVTSRPEKRFFPTLLLLVPRNKFRYIRILRKGTADAASGQYWYPRDRFTSDSPIEPQLVKSTWDKPAVGRFGTGTQRA